MQGVTLRRPRAHPWRALSLLLLVLVVWVAMQAIRIAHWLGGRKPHWLAGRHDTIRTLRHPEILERPTRVEGVSTFDLGVNGRE